MKSRTICVLLTASVMIAGGVSACVPSPRASPTPQPTAVSTTVPSPTPQSIEALDPKGCEVHMWHSFTGPREAALQALVAKFEADNTYGIKMRVEFHSPLHKEVLASFAAGTPPDIVVAGCDLMAAYAQLDALVSLGDYLSSAKYGLSQTERADQWPVVLQAGYLSAGSKQPMGLFLDAQAVVMFYNARWLKKLKFDAPPQNWDEFVKACAAARDRKAGTWGYAFAASGPALFNWIAGLGGTLVDMEHHEPQLDSQEALAAMSWLDQGVQKGYAYCASDPGADRADFAAEKALFTFGTTDELTAYTQAVFSTKTKKPRFDWSVAPLPHATSEPVVAVQGLLVGILRTTPRQQLAAWAFLRWLTRPENDAQWALATGALPLYKSSQSVPEVQAYMKQNPQYQAACQLLPYARTEPAEPRWPQVRALLVSAANSICQGKATPTDALAAADVEAGSLFQ